MRALGIGILATFGLASIGSVYAQSGDTVMRPVIPESAAPVEAISPVASDGFVGEAYLRKPPGDGPFPAVVLIHGGLARMSTEWLREFVAHVHASRFLEAGYVVVAMTRRDLNLDLPTAEQQPAVSDAAAVIDYVRGLPYVDADSVVLRATSAGAYIALEASIVRDVAAVMIEEPFSMPFVGANAAGATDAAPDTSKIERISNPMLLIRGDQTPNLNNFNRDVFIPAVEAAGKSLEVRTYPGELHSFAFYDNSERTLRPAVSLEAFGVIDAFFREHIATAPVAFDPGQVGQVPVDY